MVLIADGEKKIFELEGEILEQLANASGDILADDVLVNTLAQAKATSNEVAEATKVAETTKADIDVSREKYRVAATRGSILYFVVADMAAVNAMYNYSLVYFNVMFDAILEQAEKSEDLATAHMRTEAVDEYFVLAAYLDHVGALEDFESGLGLLVESRGRVARRHGRCAVTVG